MLISALLRTNVFKEWSLDRFLLDIKSLRGHWFIWFDLIVNIYELFASFGNNMLICISRFWGKCTYLHCKYLILFWGTLAMLGVRNHRFILRNWKSNIIPDIKDWIQEICNLSIFDILKLIDFSSHQKLAWFSLRWHCFSQQPYFFFQIRNFHIVLEIHII